MPQPGSVTRSDTPPASGRASSAIVPPASVAFTALSTRLSTTCFRRAPSVAQNPGSKKADDDFGAEQLSRPKSDETPSELHSRIEGTIQEFSGRAVFVLENGQIWQQRIPQAYYFPHKLVNPEVIITKGLGGYKMAIVAADAVVFVKRIQ